MCKVETPGNSRLTLTIQFPKVVNHHQSFNPVLGRGGNPGFVQLDKTTFSLIAYLFTAAFTFACIAFDFYIS